MDTLLWLMLGAAVQCNQRVAIVEAIKTLPVEVQQAIAIKIKEVMNMNVHELTLKLFSPLHLHMFYSYTSIFERFAIIQSVFGPMI